MFSGLRPVWDNNWRGNTGGVSCIGTMSCFSNYEKKTLIPTPMRGVRNLPVHADFGCIL